MEQAGDILKMLVQVLLELLKLFVGFMIQAFNLVLQFAQAVADMVK